MTKFMSINQRLRLALLGIFLTALATAGMAIAKTDDGATFNNKAGTAIAITQTSAGFNTAITQTGATLAPDGNSGFTLTNAGTTPIQTSPAEQARFKDVTDNNTGTPPEAIMTATSTAAPPDNVQVAITNQKTDDGFNVGAPTDQALMAAAFQAIQVANQNMAGITGSNVARHYGGMEAANAPYDGFGTVAGTATQIV